jgi:Protein of unknown function (DUF2848)
MDFRVSGKACSIELQRAVMAGYTGRDQKAVQQHLDELRKLGVPAPERVPAFYPVSPYLVRTTEVVPVVGAHTSGEGEVVLIVTGDNVLIGVGSDHTDREVEKLSVPKSKQLCAKPVSAELWPLDEVRSYWDELELRSWVGEGAERSLYQRGFLAELLQPDTLLGLVGREYRSNLQSAAIFGGTLPLVGGEFRYGSEFAVELCDPRRQRSLYCRYAVQPLG